LALPLLAICGQMGMASGAQAAAAPQSAPAQTAPAPALVAPATAQVAPAPAQTAPALTKVATAPTAFELQLLYADRTWNWADGAAYFAKDRSLRAWSQGKDTASVGEGRWLVTNTGKMCMDLAWRGKTYSSKLQRTCYSHRIEGGKIEQRKDPNGQWYSFKHTPETASDEYKKFDQGDGKGGQFEAARKLIDTKS